MKIGLNLLYLLPGIVGGTETYAIGLLEGLAELESDHEFFVFLNQESKDWPIPEKKNFTRIVCNVTASNRGMRYAYEQIVLPRLASRYRLDVLHSLGYTGPLRLSCRSVISILDMNYKAFGKQIPLLRRLTLSYFVKCGARASDHIITISEFSRREIQRYLGTSAEKITAIHIAPHPGRVYATDISIPELHKKLGLQKPYWVAFSSVSPNKNIPNLLRAVFQLRQKYGLKNQLVFIGHMPQSGETAEALRAEGCESVVFTGFINDKDVSAVLSSAQMLIFPSFYEGFGLPVVEAMASGVPVTCSNAASLPEIAGDAALYFDSFSADDIAEKIHKISTSNSLRDELRSKGYANIKRFSWRKTAQQTIEVYERFV